MTTENEDRFADMFAAAAADLYPPITEMLEYSMARGAKVRRRRTVFSLAGGTGALAAIVAVTLTVAHPGTGSSTGAPADGPAVSAGAVLPGGGPSTDAYYQVLSSLLPPGNVVEAVGGPDMGVAVDYDDGHGVAGVEVQIQLYSEDHVSADNQSPRTSQSCAGWAQGTDYGTRPADAPAPGCDDVVLPDGTTKITMVTGTDANGVYYNEVEYFRTDGVEVVASAGNGVLEVDGATRTTRDLPVLSVAQLTAIASDRRW